MEGDSELVSELLEVILYSVLKCLSKEAVETLFLT